MKIIEEVSQAVSSTGKNNITFLVFENKNRERYKRRTKKVSFSGIELTLLQIK